MLDRRNFLKSAASVAALGVSAIPATADPFALSDHGGYRSLMGHMWTAPWQAFLFLR